MKLKIRRFNHVQIPIPLGMESEARIFYGDLLGLEEIEAPEVLRKKGFFWYQVGDGELHLGPEEDFHVSKRHPAYEIENLLAFKAYLLERGVKIGETDRLPDRERFFAYDPFGNRIELLEVRSEE